MDLSKQVCTLEQAKKLKELGIEQNSAFYFYEQIVNGKRDMKLHPIEHHDGYGSTIEDESIMRALNGQVKNEVYSAYTAAELGVMLGIDKTLNSYNDLIKKWYYQGYTHRDNLYNTYGVDTEQYTKNEAYRRAADLIVGLSIKRLTPEEVNTRLKNS